MREREKEGFGFVAETIHTVFLPSRFSLAACPFEASRLYVNARKNFSFQLRKSLLCRIENDKRKTPLTLQ